MPYFNNQGTRLYFEDRGKGQPLLLLAGLGMVVGHWKGQLNLLNLAQQFRVISLENRGIGKSDMPEGPYHVKQLAHDACALLNHLELEQCSVVGHSMGGFTAQVLAAQHPERIKRLVVAFSGKKLPAVGVERLKLGVELRKANVPRRLRTRIAFLGFYDRSLYEDRLTAKLWLDAAQLPPEPELEGLEAQVAACLTHDASQWCHKIVAPTLVVAGDSDQIFPATQAAHLAEELVRGEFQLVKDCGHTPFGQSASAFTSAIQRFIDE